jgi:putative nucleotidyltransferase with HDIG domain
MEDQILVVDDDAGICDTLAERLTMEGYTSAIARNGKEALHLLYSGKNSLMITDIRMPEMDGLELLKEAKALFPHVTVIMMTGYLEINKVVDALRFGADDFILKPFDFELVVFSVKRALEKKRLQDMIDRHDQHLEALIEKRTAALHMSYGMLKAAHLNSVKMLVEAINAKDPYTRGHSDRVRKWSVQIAKKLELGEKKLENLEFGALLHDIGMIGIKDEILHKQDPLSPEEYRQIQEHSSIGVKIVEEVSFFKDVIPMIRHHHERFDSSGYPDGLGGEDIPFGARIISIPDAFDAMTNLRPYRQAMSLQDALVEMEKGKGKQFDPRIVDVFLKEKIYKIEEGRIANS